MLPSYIWKIINIYIFGKLLIYIFGKLLILIFRIGLFPQTNPLPCHISNQAAVNLNTVRNILPSYREFIRTKKFSTQLFEMKFHRGSNECKESQS